VMIMDCAYTKTEIDQIRKEIERRLSPKRFDHSCRTAEIALRYADELGYDRSKAEIAALLHDVAREYTPEQAEEAAQKYSVRLSRYNIEFPPSIHALIGAAVAENEFGITDREILNSIRNHVSGRPCMKTLEKIIFIADHIARPADFFPEKQRFFYEKPFDEVLFHLLHAIIDYDVENGKIIDERTMQTFDWLLNEIDDRDKKGQYELSDAEWKKFFEETDKLIDLCKEHMIRGFPAKNMRDLGGYNALDGRVIRKNKILRSGNLDCFTKSDFEKLLALGINYVVDLRTDCEKLPMCKEDITGLHFIDVPFDPFSGSKTYLESLLEWYAESDDLDEAAWLTAQYANSSDIDNMYLSLMFAADSLEKFRTILKTMMRDDCTGIIFFCNAGKDRTGIVSSVIMNALGVGGDTAEKDFLASQIPSLAVTMDVVERLRKGQFNLTVQNKMVSVLGVEMDRPERMNWKILRKYGDYTGYFNVANFFGPDEIQRFRDKYLK